MSLFSNLADALNSSVLAIDAEPVTYLDRLGSPTSLDAVYFHDDDDPAVEIFEARESDFPSFPQPQETIQREDGTIFKIQKIKRKDGGWLQLSGRSSRPPLVAA